jgi:hypothetical protein
MDGLPITAGASTGKEIGRPPLRRRKAGEAGRVRVLDASAVAEPSF